jgi:hypothetical protein
MAQTLPTSDFAPPFDRPTWSRLRCLCQCIKQMPKHIQNQVVGRSRAHCPCQHLDSKARLATKTHLYTSNDFYSLPTSHIMKKQPLIDIPEVGHACTLPLDDATANKAISPDGPPSPTLHRAHGFRSNFFLLEDIGVCSTINPSEGIYWHVGVLLGGGALAAGTHTPQGSSTAHHDGPIFLYIKDKYHNSDWEFFGVVRGPQELNWGGRVPCRCLEPPRP